jgi:uncharacterized membrane protein
MLDRNNLVWPKMLVSPDDGALLVSRLFVLCYGVSAVPAALLAMSGASLLNCMLVFWLGGVAAVLAASLALARFKQDNTIATFPSSDAEQRRKADRLR